MAIGIGPLRRVRAHSDKGRERHHPRNNENHRLRARFSDPTVLPKTLKSWPLTALVMHYTLAPKATQPLRLMPKANACGLRSCLGREGKTLIRNRFRKTNAFVIAVFALCVAMMTVPTAALAQEPLYIGLFAPLSGDNAEYGQKFDRAITLYVEKLNAAGGIHGRPIEILREDDRAIPQEAANIARRFASDSRILATIGSFSSTAALAAAPIFERAGIVQISPSSSHPDFTAQGTYMFRNVNTQDIEGPLNAEFVAERLGAKNVAVIYRQDDWGMTASQAFVRGAEELGINIAVNQAVIEGTRDFRPLITRLRSMSLDAIYIALFYADAAVFAQQAKQAGLNVPMVTNSSLSNPQFITLGGDAVEGVYVPTNFFPGDPDPVVQTFMSEYRARWNDEPDQFAAIAYDSIAVIAEAIRNILDEGRPLTRQAIRDELYNLPPYRGASGLIQFDERGDVRKPMTWLVIRDGQFQILD